MGDSKRRKAILGAKYWDGSGPKPVVEDPQAEVLMEATPREILAEFAPPLERKQISKAKMKRLAKAARVKAGLPAKKPPVRGIRAQKLLRQALNAVGRFWRWCWMGAPAPDFQRVAKRWLQIDERTVLSPEQLQLIVAGGIGTSPSRPEGGVIVTNHDADGRELELLRSMRAEGGVIIAGEGK